MEEIKRFPWRELIINFIWIVGAAIILASLSWHEFKVRETGLNWKNILKSKGFRRPIYLGLFFILTGVAATVNSPWLSVLAGLPAGFFLILFLQTYLKPVF
ncbi:MAG: hypothetical protein N3B16_01900 [Candidatus Aminicenantes bacterium]|nr:hypothetical protein [Candidatus Aminicenantes bacterium]